MEAILAKFTADTEATSAVARASLISALLSLVEAPIRDATLNLVEAESMAVLGAYSVQDGRNFAGCYLNAAVQALLSSKLFLSLIDLAEDAIQQDADPRFDTLAIFAQLIRFSIAAGKNGEKRRGESLNLAPLHNALAAGPYKDGQLKVLSVPEMNGESQEEASKAYLRIMEMLRLGSPSIDLYASDRFSWIDEPLHAMEYGPSDKPAGGEARTVREHMSRLGQKPTVWDWLTLWVERHVFKCTRCGRCVEELQTFDQLVLRGPVTSKRPDGKRVLVTLNQLLANYGRAATQNKREQHCPSETCRGLGKNTEYKILTTMFERLPRLMVIEIELGHPNDAKKKLNFDLDFSPDIASLDVLMYDEDNVRVPVKYLAAVAHTSHKQLSTQSGHYYTYARREVSDPQAGPGKRIVDVCIDDSQVRYLNKFNTDQDGVINEFRRTNLLFFEHETPSSILDPILYWVDTRAPKNIFQLDEPEPPTTADKESNNATAIVHVNSALESLTDAELAYNLSETQPDSDLTSVNEWAQRLAQLPVADRKQIEDLMPLDTETQRPGSETQEPYEVLVPETQDISAAVPIKPGATATAATATAIKPPSPQLNKRAASVSWATDLEIHAPPPQPALDDSDLLTGFIAVADFDWTKPAPLTWDTTSDMPAFENKTDTVFPYPQERLSVSNMRIKAHQALAATILEMKRYGSFDPDAFPFATTKCLSARGDPDPPRKVMLRDGFDGDWKHGSLNPERSMDILYHRRNGYGRSSLVSATISRQIATSFGSYVYVIYAAGGFVFLRGSAQGDKPGFDHAPKPLEKEITFADPIAWQDIVGYRRVADSENPPYFSGSIYVRPGLEKSIMDMVVCFLSNPIAQ